MDVLGPILSVAAVVLAGAAAVAAALQAREARKSRVAAETARDESRVARDESVELARQAVAEAARLADNVAETNRLAAAALPVPKVAFTIRQVNNSLYEIVNTGDLVAKEVLVEGAGQVPNKVQPDETDPRDLTIGDSLGFYVMKTMGPSPVVRVSWLDHETGERTQLERKIR